MIVPPATSRNEHPGREGFAAHLERIEEVIEPDIPDHCPGLERVLIGEDRSERLDVVPPSSGLSWHAAPNTRSEAAMV